MPLVSDGVWVRVSWESGALAAHLPSRGSPLRLNMFSSVSQLDVAVLSGSVKTSLSTPASCAQVEKEKSQSGSSSCPGQKASGLSKRQQKKESKVAAKSKVAEGVRPPPKKKAEKEEIPKCAVEKSTACESAARPSRDGGGAGDRIASALAQVGRAGLVEFQVRGDYSPWAWLMLLLGLLLAVVAVAYVAFLAFHHGVLAVLTGRVQVVVGLRLLAYLIGSPFAVTYLLYLWWRMLYWRRVLVHVTPIEPPRLVLPFMKDARPELMAFGDVKLDCCHQRCHVITWLDGRGKLLKEMRDETVDVNITYYAQLMKPDTFTGEASVSLAKMRSASGRVGTCNIDYLEALKDVKDMSVLQAKNLAAWKILSIEGIPREPFPGSP